MKTEAWWVCNVCKKPTIKVGKKHIKMTMFEHRKLCHQDATFSIVQVQQGKSA